MVFFVVGSYQRSKSRFGFGICKVFNSVETSAYEVLGKRLANARNDGEGGFRHCVTGDLISPLRQRLNLIGLDRHAARQQLAAFGGDERVALDANADVP